MHDGFTLVLLGITTDRTPRGPSVSTQDNPTTHGWTGAFPEGKRQLRPKFLCCTIAAKGPN